MQVEVGRQVILLDPLPLREGGQQDDAQAGGARLQGGRGKAKG